MQQSISAILSGLAIGSLSLGAHAACDDLPDHAALTAALQASVAPTSGTPNGGFDLNMWASIVDRDGIVCAVARSGADRGDQWPGSRVISAQKANTANAFSLPGLALSTANLWAATQPGGSLFGLQFSNPVDPQTAYGGARALGLNTAEVVNYGTVQDPMVGSLIGGVNVFGGGLALYNEEGTLVGAIGVSGDTSCADHNIAWRTRDALGLDFVPGGVGDANGVSADNVIFDLDADGASASGFGHPTCGGPGDVDDNGNPDDAEDTAAVVAETPIGVNP
ncbi:MAG: heme-binding protein [Pseudomonadota bacterium]